MNRLVLVTLFVAILSLLNACGRHDRQPTMNAITSTQNPPTTSLELFSPSGFLTHDALAILRIGNREFTLSGYKDGSTQTLIFSIPANQFAALSDGDLVRLDYGSTTNGPQWFFGPLDKSQLHMQEQLRPTKQSALDALTALKAQARDPQEVARFETAIQQLRTGLDLAHWRDTNRLQPTTGATVFAADRDALTTLQQIIEDPTSLTEPLHLIDLIKHRIVRVDQGLALVALAEAQAAGQASTVLDQARAAVEQGDRALISRDYARAIASYRDVWQLVSGEVIGTPSS